MANIEGTAVGRVAETAIYPFKGMQGLKMDEISLRSVSVAGDRTRAFTITDSLQTPTFLDTTKFPGLLKYAPSLVSPSDPKNSEVNVRTPGGNNYSADSEELLVEVSEVAKKKLAVVRMGRGAYHSMPVSLLSMASIRDIELTVGHEVDTRRFRENILVETDSDEPYQENGWLGKIVTFGERPDSARIAVVKLDPRCATINMDPETGKQTPDILRTVVKNRDNNFGIYASIVKEGRVLPGDVVYVSDLE